MILLMTMLGLLGGTVAQADSPIAQNEKGAVVADPDTSCVPGFSWIEKDHLAAMARPGRKRDLEVDLAWLQSAGIVVLVSLTEEPVPAEILEEYGMKGLHLPVEDYTPPTLEQIERFLEEVDQAKQEDIALGIHCTAGKGRTGTMLAAYLVTQGFSVEEAIAEIRKRRPGSVETPEQETRVAEFARMRENPGEKK